MAVTPAHAGRLAPAHAGVVTDSAWQRPVRDEDGLAELFDRAAAAAVQWLPDVHFAGITVRFDGAPVTAAATDERVRAVDEAQYVLGDGPCLHALANAVVVAAGPDEVHSRWPALAEVARRHGVRSFLAAPLLDDGPGSAVGAARGSINLYSAQAVRFGTRETEFVAALAAHVSRGLGEFTALRTARQQADQYREAMAHRAPIEQAKGILMAVHRIDNAAAFEILRKQSQDTNTKLHTVASTFVATQSGPAAPPGATGAVDFRSAFTHAPIAMTLTDPHGVLLTVNPKLSTLLGRTAEELRGTMLLDHTHTDDREGALGACRRLGEPDVMSSRFDCRLTPRDGPAVPVRVSASKVVDGQGVVSHLVMHIEDITDHRTLSDSLRLRALHDPLTMLPNRQLLIDRLAHALSRHHRHHEPVTVLYLDLDRFKDINDVHGHAVGDAVLVTVAARLRSALRTGDTVARLGGDEFVVVCEDTDAAQSSELVRRLRWAVTEPMELDGLTLRVSASIGSTTTDGSPTTTAADLLHAADTAMYEVKRRLGTR